MGGGVWGGAGYVEGWGREFVLCWVWLQVRGSRMGMGRYGVRGAEGHAAGR